MTKLQVYLVLLFLLSTFLLQAGGTNWHFERKVHVGDSLEWANKDFVDSTWLEWFPEREDYQRGIFWVRIHAEFSEEHTTVKNQGILIVATGAYEAYFDGVYIGKNGELKTDTTEEVPGTYNAFFPLPDSLSVGGKHVLAMRTTKQFTYPGQHSFFQLDDYASLLRYPLQISKYMFLIAGAFILTAIYFLFVFFSRPKEFSPLIFSLICLILCSLLMMEYLKWFYLYEYPFQRIRLIIIAWCHILLAFLVPLFLMLQFDFPWKKWLLGALVLGIGFIDYFNYYAFDWKAIAHNKIMWAGAFIVVLYAVYRRQTGARTILVGLVLGLAIIYVFPHWSNSFLTVFEVSQFIAFVIIILLLLYIMSLRRREERKAFEASLVLSERLKNELLKKNIKPHFIMNTLTSLIDWVEEAPKEGVKFITALASEFEALNEIADHQLVPVGQEIKLCKNHLKVMGYRKEIKYEWEEKGIDYNEIIPPAIIHTAVENGVTHSLPNTDGTIIFRLIFEKNASSKRYILQTIAKNRMENSDVSDMKEGTGMKYIRARLQESFPDKWRLTSQAKEDGWETIFEIFAASRDNS